jgi:hypothetical protein
MEATQVLTQPLVVAEEGTAARGMVVQVLEVVNLVAEVKQRAAWVLAVVVVQDRTTTRAMEA